MKLFTADRKSEVLLPESYQAFFEKMQMEKRYWMLDYVWNKWYRRDVIQKYGLRFPEELSLGEDFVFNTGYFAKVSSIVLIGEPLYHYQVNEGGLASRFQPEPWIGRSILYEAHRQLYRSLGILETEQAQIDEQAGQIAFGDIRMINYENCHLKFPEKRDFVKNMMESGQFPLILHYLNIQSGNKEKGKKRAALFWIYKKIFSSRSVLAVTGLILLENHMKRERKKWNRN